MKSQDHIPQTSLGRMAALAGAGAQVGVNYLKHYGKRAVGAASTENELHEANAATVYKTFSELKGGPLKVAQMLSIDRNILPEAYSQQFAAAQYSAPPLSYPLVVRTFQKELGRQPLEVFDEFSREAKHGASIGQVHQARKGQQIYAVKVQYPGVAESVKSDLRVVKPVALRLFGLKEEDVAEYFQEVETRLLEETDYELELQRSVELSEACADVPNVSFTRYYEELSTRRILTMDWIDGVPLDKFADGPATQEERDRIGQALWDFYHRQVHELLYFHADPHPGNFLVANDRLYVIDFGCAKKLDPVIYRKQFRLLDPHLGEDMAALEAALVELNVLLPRDNKEDRALLMQLISQSIRLLARPFQDDVFDFGDPRFMGDIYELGEANRDNPRLKAMRGPRGSAETLYVNRAYFGLYALLSRLRSRVRISRPAFLEEQSAITEAVA